MTRGLTKLLRYVKDIRIHVVTQVVIEQINIILSKVKDAQQQFPKNPSASTKRTSTPTRRSS